MVTSQKGLDLIKSFEGCRLKAYRDAAGIPTIGWGTIRYPSGKRVQMGEQITQGQADEYLHFEVDMKAGAVSELVRGISLTQNQFDALVCFAYNVGTGGLAKSTLLKKLKVNPNDPAIRAEFLRWNRAGGKVLSGLTKRRAKEADLYFTLLTLR